MAIIDPDGLFNGERISRCSDMARLYWPHFLLASNGYGRLELNYQRIVAKAFANFKTPPSEVEVFGYLKEYHLTNLLFLYDAHGSRWGQWDIPDRFLPRYKTSGDKKSPFPPPREFEQWRLNYQSTKSSQMISNEQFTGFQKDFGNISETFRHGVGVGVGIGIPISETFQKDFGKPIKEVSVVLEVKPAPDEEVYDLFPRKKGRKSALSAIGKAHKRLLGGKVRRPDGSILTASNSADAWELLKRLTAAYAGERAGQDENFTPYPATWFNGDRYAELMPRPQVKQKDLGDIHKELYGKTNA